MSAAALKPKRVLVIGGGPTGLVALRNLIERGQFEHVELVERRDDIGGVWYLDNPAHSTDSESPRWPSPAYPGLVGNVLPEFLSFSQYPFPEPPSAPNQPFPTLTETHDYLHSFAEPYVKSGVIRLSTDVVRVEELVDGRWKASLRDWSTSGKGKEVEETWDAVVVAVGWYDNPVWPQTHGLEELKSKGLAKHAKWWRGPRGHEGKRVLVVGNANSSNDMAAQLAPLADTPVYQSIRREAFHSFVSLSDERISMVAPVAKYILKSTTDGDKFDVTLTDGKELKDFDTVWIGTGYKPHPNFIHVLDPSDKIKSKHVSLTAESTSHTRVPWLHRFILYAYNPSLAFIGAPMVYTPFTIADLVSTWLSLAWRGEIAYPDTAEGRLVFEKERIDFIDKWRAEMDNPSSLMVFSVLGPDEEEYGRALKAEIVDARPELKNILTEWSEERTKLRETTYPLKYKALVWTRDQQSKH
ncbi:hypothetical protein BDQ12DRAFT_614699 [Crucibulum laeve]|uniref:FAD/NAD(P)-binding domain-containing protein n=1 Tax=Crucibulum laeve TaxID=68775 RepID=A0A5C3LKX1_9AGAR|nr:hypothetical protein BDQ12DRAFT_614699 [Crucibulum laeve]